MAKKEALDRIDYAILEALQNDARLSNRDLAAHVGLAPSSCLERVRKLTADGVIRGYHADVDPRSLGIGLEALVSVRVRRHSRRLIERFHAHITSVTEVVNVFHVAGTSDFLVHVVARDSDHLRELAYDAFTTRSEVEHLETALIFEHNGRRPLPNLNISG